MKKWVGYLLPVALLAFLFLAACNQVRLTAADTVTPRLASPLYWTAGAPGQIEVRLQARLANGDLRDLPFGVGDPVATVTFFRGEEPLSPPVTVTLDHHC